MQVITETKEKLDQLVSPAVMERTALGDSLADVAHLVSLESLAHQEQLE